MKPPPGPVSNAPARKCSYGVTDDPPPNAFGLSRHRGNPDKLSCLAMCWDRESNPKSRAGDDERYAGDPKRVSLDFERVN